MWLRVDFGVAYRRFFFLRYKKRIIEVVYWLLVVNKNEKLKDISLKNQE